MHMRRRMQQQQLKLGQLPGIIKAKEKEQTKSRGTEALTAWDLGSSYTAVACNRSRG